jgi:DNA-binding CsgD family transcriptional regulator
MPRMARDRRRELLAIRDLCYAGLDVEALCTAVNERLTRCLRADAVVFAQLDPATGLHVACWHRGWSGELFHACMTRAFFASPAMDPGRLAPRRKRVYRVEELAAEDGGDASADPWLRLRAEHGLAHEVAVSLAEGGRGWGHLHLSRRAEGDGGGGPFTSGDLEFLSALVPHLTAAMRNAAVRAALAATGGGRAGTGVVALDAAGAIEFATGVGRRAVEPGTALECAVQPLLARLRRQIRGDDAPAPIPTLTINDRDTRALYRLTAELVAAEAEGGARRGLLLLEPARAAHELETLLHFGLTAREGEVVLGVLRGDKSARIAARLGISAHTVEHHLRHVFAKVGVGSRPALAARLMGVLEELHAPPSQGRAPVPAAGAGA